jgi:hypothetical protein
VKAAATGYGAATGRSCRPRRPARRSRSASVVPRSKAAGRWHGRGRVAVTTVYAKLKAHCDRRVHARAAQAITGVHPANVRAWRARFAKSGAGMIYAGYRSAKWLHGDMLHRAWLLMCALTGNTGREGGGMQTTQNPNADGFVQFGFAGIGPRAKVAAISVWDYARGDGRALNAQTYGEEFAEHVDKNYREAIRKGWMPDYSRVPWKMAFMAGHNTGNWRAAGTRFRETVLAKLDTIVALTPDMSVTALYADYVLPIAHHYERQDFVMEGRTPYVQVIDRPCRRSANRSTTSRRWSASPRPSATGCGPRARADRRTWSGASPSNTTTRSCTQLLTMDGSIRSSRDIAEFLIDNSAGIPKSVRGAGAERLRAGRRQPPARSSARRRRSATRRSPACATSCRTPRSPGASSSTSTTTGSCARRGAAGVRRSAGDQGLSRCA